MDNVVPVVEGSEVLDVVDAVVGKDIIIRRPPIRVRVTD